jgi:hypothetical protein
MPKDSRWMQRPKPPIKIRAIDAYVPSFQNILHNLIKGWADYAHPLYLYVALSGIMGKGNLTIQILRKMFDESLTLVTMAIRLISL